VNLVIISSHGILEYDDLRLFTALGHDVFMPGGYENPAEPGEALRPAVPEAPYHADFARLCRGLRAMRGDPAFRVDWAKARLHPAIIEWADAIIVNCFPEVWIGGQWDALKGKRVIWRTIGQSSPDTERAMARYRADGLEIVRYSPAERRGFTELGAFAGEDVVIRFAKDPADWFGWTGEEAVVGNLSQHGAVAHDRDTFINWPFFEQSTKGLPVAFAGRNSEKVGGIGSLDYDAMRAYLRRIRAYLYTGTRPASYTLGLMEAMLTGVPVVSIGRAAFGLGSLFEADELTELRADTPDEARGILGTLLDDIEYAGAIGAASRRRAIELFGTETIGAQWQAFLDGPSPSETARGAAMVAA
jgi:hypothetical protein